MACAGSPPLPSDFLQEMLRDHAFDPDPQGELFDDFRHGLASFIRNSSAKINDLDDRMKTLQLYGYAARDGASDCFQDTAGLES